MGPKDQQAVPSGPGQGQKPLFQAESSSASGKGKGKVVTHSQPSVTPGISGGGGGSHRSINPDFKVNPANGTMSLSLPIHTSPGRSDFGPKLSLSYDSGSGNGPFGFGWHLSTTSVSRKTSKSLPLYDDSDNFVISDFEDLVPAITAEGSVQVTQTDGFQVRQYKPRVEGETVQIECWTEAKNGNNMFWRTISGSNITTYYGETDESRVFDVDDQGRKRVFSWLACRTFDSHGNAVEFSYKAENSDGIEKLSAEEPLYEMHRTSSSRSRARYLKRIKYGNKTPNRNLETWKSLQRSEDWMFEVVLDYGEHDNESPGPKETREWELRKFPFSVYNTCFEVRHYRLCRRIMMFHRFPETGREDCLVSMTGFSYDEVSGSTFLRSFISNGHVPSGSHGYKTESLPPLEFEYTQSIGLDGLSIQSVPLNTLHHLSSPNGFKPEWVDLEGDGAPGILLPLQDGSWEYQRNEMLRASDMHGFGPIKTLPFRPLTSFGGDHYFEDINGDGNMDVVYLDATGELGGFHERLEEEWTDYSEFPSIPKLSLSDPAIKRVDLTGNGLQDILKEDDFGDLIYYPNLGKKGFGPGKRVSRAADGPNIISRDYMVMIALADMSGDGLTDVVEVRNGRVSYWPNLGYGKFGPQVIMANSPLFDSHEQFSQSRIRLADIRGSGTTDLLYLPPKGGVHVYYNISGNEWSGASKISCFPLIDNVASIFMLDLLGNGTSCLCWSGPDPTKAETSTLLYIDLMKGNKPNLIQRFSNGIGSVTTVSFQPSTKYFLDDERNGAPWKTKLTFPVHCVSHILVEDQISQSSKRTRYAYHDGFYDGVEREFRGFGIVEAWDEEQFAMTDKVAYLQRPPIHTKTWYYTGSSRQPLDILDGFSKPSVSANKLPKNIAVDEHHSVHRSFKGQKAREELYSDDGSSRASIPYNVAEYSFELRRLQSLRDPYPGVYRVIPQETVRTHYERNLDDPKIEREISLEVNDYGDVIKSLTISEGRKKSTLAEPRDRAKQEKTWATFTEHVFTKTVKDIDYYLKPLLASTTVYQIIGLDEKKVKDIDSLTANDCQFFQSMVEAPADSTEILSGTPTKCLVKQFRTYFLNGDLSKRLPLGIVEAFSEVDQTFELAFTNEMLTRVYGPSNILRGRTLKDILDTSGYVSLDGDSKWWMPSDRQIYSQNVKENLAKARSSFYIPSLIIDPFGSITRVERDKYHYLTEKKIDPVENTVSFDNSYVHLQPYQVTDENDNLQHSAFDAFGSVVGSARAGKVDEKIGDSLDGFEPILAEEQLKQFLEDPGGSITMELLGKAGHRTIHYPGRYYANKASGRTVPSFTAEITCDTHFRERNAESKIMVKIVYLDGHGASLQQTSLCKPKTSSSSAQWHISEWVIKDSKGHPVRVCLPVFAPDHHFRPQSNLDSPKTTHLLDPLDRMIGTLYADHTWTKERLTPWTKSDYDAGDTVKIDDPSLDEDVGPFFRGLQKSEYLPSWLHSREASGQSDPWAAESAAKSLVYADSPTSSHFDSRGNVILTVNELQTGTSLSSRSEYDIAGNLVAQRDQMDRLIQRNQYDFLGRVIHECSMESGERVSFFNCTGNLIISWNSRGICIRRDYDSLDREVAVWIQEKSQAEETLIHKTSYGEAEPDGMKRNLRGQIAHVKDQSGIHTNDAFDFRGNCVKDSIQFAANYKSVLDWNKHQDLNTATFVTSTTVDALDRIVEVKDAKGCVTTRKYDHGGNLVFTAAKSKANSDPRVLVSQITYSPDDKPLRINYGNGATMEYTYDERTRKLLRQVVKRDRQILQDINNTYDCVGRVSQKCDKAQEASYFRNCKVESARGFTYDALGQLVRATGREQMDVSNGGGNKLRPYSSKSPFSGNKLPGNGEQLCQYVESYDYDDAGNILAMHHEAADAISASGWTRSFEYKEPSPLEDDVTSNRLSCTTTGEVIDAYGYDLSGAGINGCITSMPGYSNLFWDFFDQLRSSSTQIVHDGQAETTWYTYNSQGARVRKVTERACTKLGSSTPTKLKETLYLSGVDIYRTFAGDGVTVTLEKVSSHVEGLSPVAILESKTGETAELLRYQIGDNMELDDQGLLISFEEYSPFGATTFVACGSNIEAPSKYRYSAYERDTETGLYYCNRRYYAGWLGRWMSPDPLGLVDGLNLYEYVKNDPVNKYDPSGTCGGGLDDVGGGTSPKPDPTKPIQVMKNAELDNVLGPLVEPDGLIKKITKRVIAGKVELVKRFEDIKGNREKKVKPGRHGKRGPYTKLKEKAASFKSTFKKFLKPEYKPRDLDSFINGREEVLKKERVYGEQHHLFRQDYRDLFKAAGTDVDDVALYLEPSLHDAIGTIHDNNWKAFFTAELGDLLKKPETTWQDLCNHLGSNQETFDTRIGNQLHYNLWETGLEFNKQLKKYSGPYLHGVSPAVTKGKGTLMTWDIYKSMGGTAMPLKN
jgi:RHS repeat-associated protein